MGEVTETVELVRFDVGTLNEIVTGEWRRIDSFAATWDHDLGELIVTAEVVRIDGEET